MAQYCRAQAQINQLDKGVDEQRRVLNERLRTYRSLLQEELTKHQITCVEMAPANGEALYVRLKTQTTTPPLDADMILGILSKVEACQLHALAEKHGHDLPKMLSSILSSEVRDTYTTKTDKTSLSVSSTKERGFRHSSAVPDNVQQLASDFLSARTELFQLRQSQKMTKKPILEEQKSVEDVVKESLRTHDPVNMMTRVHMMQDGNEWVYFLRCKEKDVTPNIGIRKAIPLVESALVSALHDVGLGREYTASFALNATFWNGFHRHLRDAWALASQQTKRTSRLTLDRGAPRRPRRSQQPPPSEC